MTAAGVAALPAAADAQLIEAISVSDSVEVPAGQNRSLFLRCPARAVAVNVGVTSALDIADSVPRFTARGWDIRFTGDARHHRGKAVLRCVRFDMPRGVDGVSLAVETRIEPVVVSAGGTQDLKVSCSHGFTPTGWGLDRAGNALRIRTALPTRRGWRFAVENTGATPATGNIYGRCLEKNQHAETGQRHSFATRTTGRGSCRSSEFSIATGVGITGGTVLVGTGPTGRTAGQWSYRGGPPAKTSLICMSTTTQFG